jgi:hypothetical protein
MFGEAHRISTSRLAKYLMLLGFPEPLSGAAFAGFSQPAEGCKNLRHAFHGPFSIAKTLIPDCFLPRITSSSCTKSGHLAVDGLHSTENESDKGMQFSLTTELEGVQQDRSLTVS